MKRRRPFELALVIVLGGLGMAMSGTSSRAYTPLEHTAPFERPLEEAGRVARIVVVQASECRKAEPLVPRPARPAPPRVVLATTAPPAPRLRLEVPPACVRGPPVARAWS